ncbi:SusC/RagA family TonB-linked outer membrane protein [Reichenbachiella carrageenanivorans]|uniref:SusC/RagA family TonB-linked outer membrane protein n=1 Tax=Reichenbachiella carrageenanivorans TaxID=2979869 RepID=A0ABY6CWG9_9BACT|nr:SusC/RagA family TonB-linked outer membrane protein [Reichenbachiella carrageenanivorans]UXX78261.1 SusC/RagA family TonB-linked outer membrane protein [Reichenbachiella carrageenanivorans]
MKNTLLLSKNYQKRAFAALLIVLNAMIITPVFAQDTKISGVVNSETNEPLPGVTIIIQGTTNGTVSDIEGNFSIMAPSDAVLDFSFIGYLKQSVSVNGRSTIDISMEPDVEQLEEVVVVGYGTQKKSTVTGAISKVTNENLDQIAVSRVDDALIGQVSGVNIQATNAEAGAAPTITIRGFGSVNADTGPAVVVDGVVVSSDFLGNMNMNDIASFEVLKDAASAAIYGSEGANGVIMITTKSGQPGKTKFSYEGFFGFKEAFGSDDYKKSINDWAAKEMEETGELSEQTQHGLIISKAAGGLDRDWQDVFFDGGIIQSHAFSARGGDDRTSFSASMKYLHDEGVVITDDFKLFTGSIKVDTKLNKKLKFGISATPSYTTARRLPTSIHNPMRQSPWLPIYHTEETLALVNTDDPNATKYFPDLKPGDYAREDHFGPMDVDGDGDLDATARTSGDQNPYAQYVEREHIDVTTALIGATYLSYQLVDGLTAKTRMSISLDQRKRTRWDGSEYHHSNPAEFYIQNRFRTRIISDNILTYNKGFGDHDLGAMAGLTIQKRTNDYNEVVGSGYANDRLKNLAGATSVSEQLENQIVTTKVGYFARVNYSYKERYLFNASYRRDGGSVFGIDSKWGSFPAISAGWNVHNEDFMSSNNILSILKLRASYGLTGTEKFNVGDDLVNAWPYLALLNSTNNAVVNGSVAAGVSPLNVANTLLQWEGSAELSIGVDYGLLGNRITGSVDYYNRVSDNLLLQNPVSYGTGFNAAIVNLGEVRNSGFEVELRTKNIVTSKFAWSTTFIASTNKNELTAFGESNGALLEDTFGRNSQWINEIGNPISSFYGYVVDRSKPIPNEYVTTPSVPINGQGQDVVVVDLNGDGIISDADKTILGDPYADVLWSVTNEFKIGAFDVSFMFQGSYGGQIKNIGDEYFYTWWLGATTSPQQMVDDGFVSHTSFIQPKVQTDQVVQDAGYVSLRNVNIGYRLPKELVAKAGLTGVRVYASGQNLFYITSNEYHGFNPEYIDNDNNPRQYGSQRAGTPIFRTLAFGLSVDF